MSSTPAPDPGLDPTLDRKLDRTLTRKVEHVMGMPISLALRGKHATTEAGDVAWAEALVSLRAADAVFSTYLRDSAISRMNRGELRVECAPPEVREVLALAETARLDSRGAFDIRHTPDGGQQLDPSGVVKGWVVDRAAQALRELEDTDFCLSAGGDMVCHTRADSPDWRIGIENPADPSTLVATIPLRNGGIATSGLVHRGAHISDPRTNTDRADWTWASVTVIAPALTDADIDATAAFVLGDEAPVWIESRPNRAALFVRPDGSTRAVGFAQPG